MCGHHRPPRWECLSRDSLAAVPEQASYRTERERALEASILGAALGLLLALFARGNSKELAREEAADTGGHRAGNP